LANRAGFQNLDEEGGTLRMLSALPAAATQSKLTTAKGHEIRCSVPRDFVQIMELVCNFGDGCAEDRLATALVS